MKPDLEARFERAQQLTFSGEFARAGEELLWLWRHGEAVDPEFEPVKHSMVVSLLIMAGDEHAPLRSQLTAERDTKQRQVDAKFDLAAFRDLMSLFRAVRDIDGGVAWIQRALPALPRSFDVYVEVRHMFERTHRWAELGRYIGDPLAMLEARRRSWADPGEPSSEEERESFAQFRDAMAQVLRDEAGALVRALRAATRDDEANGVQSRALQLDSSKEMRAALVGSTAEA